MISWTKIMNHRRKELEKRLHRLGTKLMFVNHRLKKYGDAYHVQDLSAIVAEAAKLAAEYETARLGTKELSDG